MGEGVRAKDLKPGKILGEWTAEELRPQLTAYAWQELVRYVRLRGIRLHKPLKFPISNFDLDVFFQFTGN
jgi:hypothetical protein